MPRLASRRFHATGADHSNTKRCTASNQKSGQAFNLQHVSCAKKLATWHRNVPKAVARSTLVAAAVTSVEPRPIWLGTATTPDPIRWGVRPTPAQVGRHRQDRSSALLVRTRMTCRSLLWDRLMPDATRTPTVMRTSSQRMRSNWITNESRLRT